MSRSTVAIALFLGLVATGCVSDEVTPDEELGEGQAALEMGDNLLEPNVDKNSIGPSAIQYGLNNDARLESNAWNWSFQWQAGFWQGLFNWYEGYGYPNGLCSSYSWGNRCNSSRNTFFITPGWGANFQYYWGQPGPAGWSTFGQHPYWCPPGDIWQGWSTSWHC
jgi:hypothetical protein